MRNSVSIRDLFQVPAIGHMGWMPAVGLLLALAHVPQGEAVGKTARSPEWARRLATELDALLEEGTLGPVLQHPSCSDAELRFRCGPKLESECTIGLARECNLKAAGASDGERSRGVLWIEVDGQDLLEVQLGSGFDGLDLSLVGAGYFHVTNGLLVFRTEMSWGRGSWEAVWGLPVRGGPVHWCRRDFQRQNEGDAEDLTGCRGPRSRKWLLHLL